MSKKYVNYLSVGILAFSVILLGLTYTGSRPFRLSRGLPVIDVADVSEVSIDYFMDMDQCISYEGDMEELVSWFNTAKELKSEVGTTSDCRMTMTLQDGSEIYIWNLYSREWVTIGYRFEEDYYQTNVYSEELAAFFIDFREEMAMNIENKYHN